MRCNLIFPAWNPTEMFSSYTARNQVNLWHPTGLLYIAGMLLKEGHEVELLDGSLMTHEEILEKVEKFKPGYVGIASTTPGWKRALRTAEDVKKINKNIHVSIGGPYPIAMREKCFDGPMPMDSICFTEGEYVTAEVVSRLEQNMDLNGVEGIIFKDSEGKIIVNPNRPPIEDLDALPFPPRYLLSNLDKYVSPPGTYKRKPIVNIFTSRGCTNLCIYCFQIYRDRTIRYRSPKNVVDEIEECINRYGFKEVKFLDDQFTGDYHRVEEICRLIKERKLDITWYASAIAGTVDKKLLKVMKDAGCWAVLFGAESGVQKNLNTLQKGVTLEQIKQSVKWSKEVGIKPYTPFMFGIPGETYEDGLETIRFACELDPNYVDFNTITPFPGTTLYEKGEEYGTIAKDSEAFTFQNASFVPKTMTKEEIIKLRQLAFKKFYSRPKYILRKIFEIRSWYDIETIFKGGISLFWVWVGQDIFKPKGDKSLGSKDKAC